ncbi:MAG TPA: ThuA domain-containing protein, partial [Candidatus Binatia bacterium]|nr:ThuA domain-containing protein [Candidatus Binatia bacterium]
MTSNNRIDVYLICNARFHDTNFARLELLKLLAEHEDVMVRVAEDYRDLDAINQSQLLITYTCNVCPTPEQQEGLKKFLTNGKRWFALHATNALVEF